MTVSSWTSHSFLCRCELRWRRGQWIRVTVKRRIQQKKSRCCSLVESWCRTWISCQSLAPWLCGCPTGWRGWRRAGPCWTRSCGSCSWWPGRRWRWSQRAAVTESVPCLCLQLAQHWLCTWPWACYVITALNSISSSFPQTAGQLSPLTGIWGHSSATE